MTSLANAPHATPDQLLARADALDDEARGYEAAGMSIEAADKRADAKTLRSLARQAKASMGRMGE